MQFNVWEIDYSNNPFYTIVSEILELVENALGDKLKDEKLKNDLEFAREKANDIKKDLDLRQPHLALVLICHPQTISMTRKYSKNRKKELTQKISDLINETTLLNFCF